MSLDFGGDGFLVRRASLALAGSNGYSARANVAFRLTRRQTVAASYNYTYLDFQRTFGNSQLQTAALGYAIGLGRSWDISTQAGGIRVNTLGLTPVSLDPAVAAILCPNFALVTFSRVLYLPILEARLVRRFRWSALTLDLSSSVTPGNGVYLTSRQNAGAVAFSYTGSRRLTARWNAGYNQLSTPGRTLGKYTNLQGGGQVTFNLMHDTFATITATTRRQTHSSRRIQTA